MPKPSPRYAAEDWMARGIEQWNIRLSARALPPENRNGWADFDPAVPAISKFWLLRFEGPLLVPSAHVFPLVNKSPVG